VRPGDDVPGDDPSLLAALRTHLDAYAAGLVDVSHRVHAAPEVRFTEHTAARLLASRLRDAGLDVDEGVAGLPTAFVARTATPAADGVDDAPTVALFCEYDALEGLGHACAHNVIAAAGLGAALVTRRWMEAHPDVPARLVVLGSPAEEGGGGKTYLLDDGLLDGVDAAVMVHPTGEDRVRMEALGRVALDVTFTGRAAHASAAPYEGVNALDAVTLTQTAVGLLRQQLRPDSRVHGVVTDGGQAPNIVPARAAMRIFVRSPDQPYLDDRLVPAVEACARGAALATGAGVEITRPVPGYASMRTDETLAGLCEEGMRLLGREPADGTPGDAIGSTDMGNVSRVVASAHPTLRLRPGLVMHTTEAAEAAAAPEGDAAVRDGALLLAYVTVRVLSDTSLVGALRADC
jgi:amidohydrolase